MTAHDIYTAGFFLLLGGLIGFSLAMRLVRESVAHIHRRYQAVKDAADELVALIKKQAEEKLYFQEKFQEHFQEKINDKRDKENNHETR